ncbi:MAG TPA: carboxypeptidase-like regulatory domain-containing protein, partial [Chitinophagaceae bacterium]|nr:carboxypeptidase-like regulatory domain-containing protein [Chitinophagaceae bacterium]
MLKRTLFLFVCALAASGFVFGQLTTSSLTGSIKDSSDNPLLGATIRATHIPTGTRYQGITQSGGRFSIQDMRPGGPYTVEITFVGFEPITFTDVYLRLAEPYLLNVLMAKAVGALENVVLTTSQRRNQIFNASRMGATTNIGRREIELLPTIARSVNDLTRIAPQANGNQIAGGNYRQNNFTIDGSYFNNSFGIGTNLPANGSPISLDAIDEISVNISPYDIRQSGFIGSAINAVTRSGTNNFSGSVYEYWRNQNQQGGRVGKITFTRTPFTFKQQGFRIGGPIIKNKLFFFFNYEIENQPKQVQTRFASTSAAPFGSSSNIARPTADSINIIRNYLLNTYGYDTGPFDNYSTAITRKKYLGRIDWNIGRNQHLVLRYSQVEGGEPTAPSSSTFGSNFPGYPNGQGRNDINNLWGKNSNYFQGSNFYSFAGELTSKFGRKVS